MRALARAGNASVQMASAFERHPGCARGHSHRAAAGAVSVAPRDGGPQGEITMDGGLRGDGAAKGPTAIGGGWGPASDVMGIQRRNLEALAEAQWAMVEGLGALAERQIEAAGAAVRGSLALLSPVPFGCSRAGVERRIDALKAALLDRTANSSLLAETAGRANAKVACILQERTLAALDELKAALVGAPVPGGPAVALDARPGRLASADA